MLFSNARLHHVGICTLRPTSSQRATNRFTMGSPHHVLCLLSKESLSTTCTKCFQTHRFLMVFGRTSSPSAYFIRLPSVPSIPPISHRYMPLFLKSRVRGACPARAMRDRQLSFAHPFSKHLKWHSRAELRPVRTAKPRIAPVYRRLSRSKSRTLGP